MANILVVDDEKSITNTLKDIFQYESHSVSVANTGMEAIDKLAIKKFDAVFCDIKMPEMDGIELLKVIAEKYDNTPVIMISGHADIEIAVETIKLGAFDFIEKPLDLNRILITLKNALDKTSLVAETKILKRKVSKTFDIIGESDAIVKVKNMIDRVAPTDARVLITGNNGTGKELVARWLHQKSNRYNAPFIEVNCAAIPSELIESELFGHEKGAFTSAHKDRKGKFEQANGGTLFLDEIGDMSLSAQAKVLRALQENKITRVGSDKDVNINVRIIAATNKDLSKEIVESKFREDLYHRLSVIIIKVPALKDRLDDIPLLAEHFINLICSEYGEKNKKISPKAIELLQKMNWSGNIREFRNVIERLIILSTSDITDKEVIAFASPVF